MCVGLEKRHGKCHHLKVFVILIRCGLAYQTGDLCRQEACYISGREPTSPPLCLNCHQNAERDIRNGAEADIQQMTREIGNAEDAAREALALLSLRVATKDRREKERDLAIAELRESQMAWY